MDAEDLRRAVTRIAHEIVEHNQGLDGVILVGLQTGGVPLAGRLAETLRQIEGVDVPIGTIDVAFYRDDIGLRPVKSTSSTRITARPVRSKGMSVTASGNTGRNPMSSR